jgi:uncharacterized membrane protein YfcA
MTEPQAGSAVEQVSATTVPPALNSTSLVSALGVIAILLLIEVTALRLGGPSPTCLTSVFIASTISSIAGFAFSAICGALLFHLLAQPVQIVQILLVSSIAIQLFSVISLGNTIDWKHLSRFLAGGLFGLPIGVYLLTHLDTHLYLKSIGICLIAYGLFMLLRRPRRKTINLIAGDYAVGFLGGITGGFVAFPGAFVTIWCGLKGWPKERQRGVYQPFILIMQVIALLYLSALHMGQARAGETFDLSIAAYVPGALLGTWCGIAIFRRLTDVQFARVVNTLLIVSGVGLLA